MANSKMNLHHNCHFCEKSFSSWNSKNYHERNIHKKLQLHSCDECGKRFYRKFTLKMHKQNHSANSEHICKICSKKFKSALSVKTHLEIHTDRKSFMCEICGKVFRTLGVLQAHNNMHTKQKSYSCQLCEKSYTYRASLFLHMRTHSGQRPYQCKECDSSFIVKSHLTDHMRTHTQEKPFECKYCQGTFARKISLKKHLKSHIRAGLEVNIEDALLYRQHEAKGSSFNASPKNVYFNNEGKPSHLTDQPTQNIELCKNLQLEGDEHVTLVISCIKRDESLQDSKVSLETPPNANEDVNSEDIHVTEIVKREITPHPCISPLSFENCGSDQLLNEVCSTSVHYINNSYNNQVACVNDVPSKFTSDTVIEGMSERNNPICVRNNYYSHIDEENEKLDYISETTIEDVLSKFDTSQNYPSQKTVNINTNEENFEDCEFKSNESVSSVFTSKCEEMATVAFIKKDSVISSKPFEEKLEEDPQSSNFCNDSNDMSKIQERRINNVQESSATLISHPLTCEVCGERFSYRSELRKHTKIHSSKHRYKCDKCNNHFQSEVFFLRHRCFTPNQPVSRTDFLSEPDFSVSVESAVQEMTNIHLQSEDEGPSEISVLITSDYEKQKNGNKQSQVCVNFDSRNCDVTEVKSCDDFNEVLSVPLNECGVEVIVQTEIQEGQDYYMKDNVPLSKKCAFCSKSFKYISTLKNHERIHTGEKPYKCSTCEKSFSKKSNLKSHQRTHSGEQSFLCDDCGKYFSYKSSLNAHKLIHTKVLPFSCEVCGKGFRYESSRHVHMKRHMGIKPFRCDFCSKDFVSKIEREDHKRTHTKEKPYQCHHCIKCFSHRHHLNNHLKIHVG